MAIPWTEEQQNDYLMSKSVMDEPRNPYQKITDFLFGRTLPEQATNAFTGMMPGLSIRVLKPATERLAKPAAEAFRGLGREVMQWLRGEEAVVPVKTAPLGRGGGYYVLPTNKNPYGQIVVNQYTPKANIPYILKHETEHLASRTVPGQEDIARGAYDAVGNEPSLMKNPGMSKLLGRATTNEDLMRIGEEIKSVVAQHPNQMRNYGVGDLPGELLDTLANDIFTQRRFARGLLRSEMRR